MHAEAGGWCGRGSVVLPGDPSETGGAPTGAVCSGGAAGGAGPSLREARRRGARAAAGGAAGVAAAGGGAAGGGAGGGTAASSCSSSCSSSSAAAAPCGGGAARVLAVGVWSQREPPVLRGRPVPPVPPPVALPPVLLPLARRANGVVLPAAPPPSAAAASPLNCTVLAGSDAAWAAMSEASGRFGTSTVDCSASPVSGFVLCRRNQRSMAARSNTCRGGGWRVARLAGGRGL